MRLGLQLDTGNIQSHENRIIKTVSFHFFLHSTLTAQLQDFSCAWVGASDLHGNPVLDQLFWLKKERKKEKRKERLTLGIDFMSVMSLFFLYCLAPALVCFASAAPAKTFLFNNQRKRTSIILKLKKKTTLRRGEKSFRMLLDLSFKFSKRLNRD